MDSNKARICLSLLREARELAQQDSEDFGALVHAFERIGAMEKGHLGNGLGDYERELLSIAVRSPLCVGKPPDFHGSAVRLFTLIQHQRNDAMHQGIVARNLVRHSIEFCLILEHALSNMESVRTAADLMVRDVCFADIEHPVSYIRQRMLVNGFSYLPVMAADGSCRMLSDFALVQWLRGMSWNEQKCALVRPLRSAIADNGCSLKLVDAVIKSSDQPVRDLAQSIGSMPILLHPSGDTTKVVGLISAFDLL